MKTALLLFNIAFFVSLSAYSFNESTSSDFDNGQQRFFDFKGGKEKAIEASLKCSFSKNKQSGEQKERADYITKHLARAISQLYPEWKDIHVQHITAQIIQETGNLGSLEEKPSKHKSSQLKHHGRGTGQTTFPENYAANDACMKKFKEKLPPAKIGQAELANAPKPKNVPGVINPDAAYSEDIEDGRLRNAISALCYFVNTSERHPQFKKALSTNSLEAANEVSKALNGGPGKLGKNFKPNGNDDRLKAFNKISLCFRNGVDI